MNDSEITAAYLKSLPKAQLPAAEVEPTMSTCFIVEPSLVTSNIIIHV